MFTVALFDEEEIHEDLHLLIAESPDESQTVVYGEVYVKFAVISDFCSVCTQLYIHVLFSVEEISDGFRDPDASSKNVQKCCLKWSK